MRPKILKVNPKQMAKFNINELTFKSASFNERKKEHESYILGCSDHYLFFWKMRDVLKNHLISSKAYKIDQNIVQGEFLYNQNNLITALPQNLVLQKMNVGEQQD